MKSSARDRLLTSAADLFYANGIEATGIDAITARAGVAKMSLYNNFASKAELVAAYLETRHHTWRDHLDGLVRTAATPEERILAVFDSYAAQAVSDGAPAFRGCGLINAAGELAGDDPGRRIAAAQKAEVEAAFRRHLADLRPGDDPAIEETALHLSLLLEGAMVRAGLDGQVDRLVSARRIASSIVAAFTAGCDPRPMRSSSRVKGRVS